MRYRTYRVTTLSPVHVGSGGVLSPTTEVFHEGDTSVILDVEAAMRAFPDFFLRYRGTAPSPGELLRYLRSQDAHDLYREVRPRIQAEQIRVQMRDGRGALLMPGSTLKGAIRTAILAWVLQKHGSLVPRVVGGFNATKPQFAASDLEKRLRGTQANTPHFDWLRAVAVSDASFPGEMLDLFQVRIRSPRREAREREEDYWLACEGIRTGATTSVRIGFDAYLLQADSREHLGWPPEKEVPFTFSWLAETCRARFLGMIDTEIGYFGQRSPIPEAVRWLSSLREQVKQAPDETVFLRLGYGIGWCGTTGEVAGPADRLRMLARCDQAGRPVSQLPASAYDDGARSFPKTRRYVRTEMEHPLFGFVRLDPADDADWPPSVGDARRFPEPRKASGPAVSVPTRPTGIQAILQAVRPQDLKGRFDGLMRQVEAVEDPAERSAAMKTLARLIQQHVPRKDLAFRGREDVARCLRALMSDEQ